MRILLFSEKDVMILYETINYSSIANNSGVPIESKLQGAFLLDCRDENTCIASGILNLSAATHLAAAL